MAILIQNMTMPDNCGECLLNHDNDYCGLTRTELWNNATYFDYHKKRMPDCPLVEVPDDTYAVGTGSSKEESKTISR